MICARCEQAIDEESCAGCGGSAIIAGAYRLIEVVGQGATGTTYRAERLEDGVSVAIKELLVRRAESLTVIDRFEREAETLRQLSHPSIPAYIENFVVEEGADVGLCLVQEFARGESLQDVLDRGELLDPAEVLDVCRQLAKVLAYLHGLSPAVIHRDIKPANIIRSSTKTMLIDFGSVTDAMDAQETEGIPTMAGTIGFMSPEQLSGRAVPASDVYALGATCVALSCGAPPGVSDAWVDHVASPLRPLLKRMLASNPANRPTSRELMTLVDEASENLSSQMAQMTKRETALAQFGEAPRTIPGESNLVPYVSTRTLIGTIMGFGAAFGLVLGVLALPLFVICFGTAAVISSAIWLVRRDNTRLLALYTHGDVAVGRVTLVESIGRVGRTIHYEFRVEGRRWKGTTSLNDPDQRVPDGADVTVFFDPRNPEENRALPAFLPGRLLS